MITYDEAVADLMAVVEGREGYVYEPDPFCMYFNPDGSPSCIVGHVLVRHGITALQVGTLNYSRAKRLSAEGVLDVDDRAENLLESVQGMQDKGIPWGEALTAALRTHPGTS